VGVPGTTKGHIEKHRKWAENSHVVAPGDATLGDVTHHLAHSNIAWMHGRIDDPVMFGLASRIDEINRLAEQSRGFIWRIPESETSFTHLEVFREDFPGFDPSRFFYNMSVWESLEHLREYTLFSAHAEMIYERRQWLDSIAGANVALWWTPEGHHPSIAESAERLRHMRKFGPTPHAFTLRHSFPPANSSPGDKIPGPDSEQPSHGSQEGRQP